MEESHYCCIRSVTASVTTSRSLWSRTWLLLYHLLFRAMYCFTDYTYRCALVVPFATLSVQDLHFAFPLFWWWPFIESWFWLQIWRRKIGEIFHSAVYNSPARGCAPYRNSCACCGSCTRQQKRWVFIESHQVHLIGFVNLYGKLDNP